MTESALMTRTRKKVSLPHLEDIEEGRPAHDVSLENFSKLDLFALFASSAVAKKLDDPVHIAHASYAVAKEMLRLSESYSDKEVD